MCYLYSMEIKPVRIQRSRKQKQVSPNGLPIVYVGRPGKWGNPFKVGEYCLTVDEVVLNPFNPKYTKVETVDQAISIYKEWLDLELKNGRLNLNELAGKNLSCWCAIVDKNNTYCVCHADLLLSLANNKSIDEIRKENIKTIIRQKP